MTTPLWTDHALVAAAEATLDGAIAASVAGFSIDTRSLQPGDVFVAITDARDGHDFVTAAFAAGAAAALVRASYTRKPGDGALLRVDDPLRALERIAIAARARIAAAAKVIAVTGSAGKTGTKEMLRACLAPLGRTHAPEKSFNNHWGVPLTLARMPADTEFAVIEIGMNHAGEITPLTGMARPDIAIITNVLPVHVGNFPDGEIGVANAKAEVFSGLVGDGGIAILPRDNPHFDRLSAAAAHVGAMLLPFGEHPQSAVCATVIDTDDSQSRIDVSLSPPAASAARQISYRLGAPGRHLALNSLAVVACLAALGRLDDRHLAPLAAIRAPAGRGARTTLSLASGGTILLIDESYNANPASMRAALANLALVPRHDFPRRVAILGDMRELGSDAPALHTALKPAIIAAGADVVCAVGAHMKGLYDCLPPSQQGGWAASSTALAPALAAALRPGDVVMIKGSLGTNMAPLVAAVRSLDVAARTSTA